MEGLSNELDPFFIYINDVPCRIEPRASQRVGPNSCLIIPKLFLGTNEEKDGVLMSSSSEGGGILLRDVTGGIYDNGAGGGLPVVSTSTSSRAVPVAEEALSRAVARGGFLLLPDPVTGLVRVERYHFYQSVRFVGGGEHLVLSGAFEKQDKGMIAVAPSMTMAEVDAINSLVSSHSNEKDPHSASRGLEPYPNALSAEMLGFAKFLTERAGGSSSIQAVTSEWQTLSEESKRRYVTEAFTESNLDSVMGESTV